MELNSKNILRDTNMNYVNIYINGDINKPEALEVRSGEHRVYERVTRMVRLYNNDQNMRKGFDKISKLISKDGANIKRNYNRKGNELVEMRMALGLPFITDIDNTYGYDLSLLDISNKVIMDGEFKDYCFAGANLKNTEFINRKFFECSFTGSDMRNIKFKNCHFAYTREIIEAEVNDQSKFINCSGDLPKVTAYIDR